MKGSEKRQQDMTLLEGKSFTATSISDAISRSLNSAAVGFFFPSTTAKYEEQSSASAETSRTITAIWYEERRNQSHLAGPCFALRMKYSTRR
jgi:hypothetical protein